MFVSYDYYRIFYHVAKYRSFTRAAEILHSNQPNVSRTIRSLEDELGVPLFHRSSRGVRLTPEGEELFTHIQVAQEQISAGEEALVRRKKLESGSISIGATETALHGLLLPLLQKYRKQYPGVQLRITNHTTRQAVSAVLAGQVDLAFVVTPADLPDELVELPLMPSQEIVVCGDAYRKLSERVCSLQELSEYPLILLGKQSLTYSFYMQFFLSHGLRLAPDIEVATADQILPMVENDLGIGFVPEVFLHSGREKGICRIELVEKIPERMISLIKRRDRDLSVAAGVLEKMSLESRNTSEESEKQREGENRNG